MTLCGSVHVFHVDSARREIGKFDSVPVKVPVDVTYVKHLGKSSVHNRLLSPNRKVNSDDVMTVKP